MRILIYGHKGWIGSMFTDYLTSIDIPWIAGTGHCDIEYRSEITTHLPTHVMSFIGRTHGTYENKKYTTIDYLEVPGKLSENINDNLYSPLVMALICQQLNVHFTYIGTGCIYSSTKEDETFSELDEPNFSGSAYSTVKSYTDRIFNKFMPNVLNLRIRMPISSIPNDRNFIDKILSYKKICSIKNSMTVLDDFIPVFYDMLSNYVTGTFNCTNPGAIEHNEILQQLSNLSTEPLKWENFSIEDQDKILLGKRSNNTLDTTKLHTAYPSIPCIHDSIKNIVKIYMNSKRNEK